MALAFDTSDAGRTGGVGATHSFDLAAAEANEIAIIFVWSNAVPSAVTVEGAAATAIGSINFAAGAQYIHAYYFLNPPTSATTTYSATSTNPELHALLYKGAKQSGQPDSSASSDQANPNPFTISTTVVASDCWLVSMARDYVSGAQSAGTGTTLREAGVGASSGDSNGVVGTGSQSMGWVPNSANEDTAGFIVSISPVAAPVAVGARLEDFMLMR